MTMIPHRFLFRLAYPCRRVVKMPRAKGDALLDLPETCRVPHFPGLDDQRDFADVRLAWNESGIGVSVEVRGKKESAVGDASKVRASDGMTLWIDTRDARSGHRATRYCHQFHLLPTGGGPERDEAIVVQAKIPRALADAPFALSSAHIIRARHFKGGYILEAFLTANALAGFDPEQSPRLGFFHAVRDNELGDQTLGVGPDFPYWEDPSLWSVLELVD